MHPRLTFNLAVTLALTFAATCAFAASNSPNNPTWWDKYEYLKNNAPLGDATATSSLTGSPAMGRRVVC